MTTRKPLTVWITTNWKILQEMGIPDHLTCLLRNLYACQEATVRIGHGSKHGSKQQTGSKLGKKYIKAVYCHPDYLTYRQSTSCKMDVLAGWRLDEAQVGIKIAGRNVNNLRYTDDTTLMEMATHSSILAWKIPWTEEPVGYSPWGCKESDTTEQLT